VVVAVVPESSAAVGDSASETGNFVVEIPVYTRGDDGSSSPMGRLNSSPAFTSTLSSS